MEKKRKGGVERERIKKRRKTLKEEAARCSKISDLFSKVATGQPCKNYFVKIRFALVVF